MTMIEPRPEGRLKLLSRAELEHQVDTEYPNGITLNNVRLTPLEYTQILWDVRSHTARMVCMSEKRCYEFEKEFESQLLSRAEL